MEGNLYSYATNSPLSFVDPSGMFAQEPHIAEWVNKNIIYPISKFFGSDPVPMKEHKQTMADKIIYAGITEITPRSAVEKIVFGRDPYTHKPLSTNKRFTEAGKESLFMGAGKVAKGVMFLTDSKMWRFGNTFIDKQQTIERGINLFEIGDGINYFKTGVLGD